jgi:hypothetical protein
MEQTDTQKKAINWRNVIIGVLAIGYFFYPQGSDLTTSDLNSKTVVLSINIETIHSTHRSTTYHRLWTKETKAAFTIASPGEVVAPDGSLDSLKKGDTLTVKYYHGDENKLNNGVKEIPIYYLQKGKRVYFELNSYNKAQDATTARYKLIALIAGIITLLNGFNVINKKLTWIIGGGAAAVVIILLCLNKF